MWSSDWDPGRTSGSWDWTQLTTAGSLAVQALRNNCKELHSAATTWVWKRTPNLTWVCNSYQALAFRVEGLAKACLDSWPVPVAYDNCVLLESPGLWQFVTQQWKLIEGNWMSHLAFLTSQFSCFLSFFKKKNSEMNISNQFSEITYLKEFYKLSTH